MPVKVIIPTPLRQYADKKESLEVQAKTVAEALAPLPRNTATCASTFITTKASCAAL